MVDSHDNEAQLDCSHIVGIYVPTHFLELPWYSPDGVFWPSNSLKKEFFLCSSSRKPKEELLVVVLHGDRLKNHSVSSGVLVESALLKTKKILSIKID